MQDEIEQGPAYVFSGPNADGLIRTQMPNVDPSHTGEFYGVALGCDKEAIAEAM